MTGLKLLKNIAALEHERDAQRTRADTLAEENAGFVEEAEKYARLVARIIKALGKEWREETDDDAQVTALGAIADLQAERNALREAAKQAREALNKVVDELSDTPFLLPESSDPCLCNEHGLCYPHAALFMRLLSSTRAALDAALGEVKDETIHLPLEKQP